MNGDRSLTVAALFGPSATSEAPPQCAAPAANRCGGGALIIVVVAVAALAFGWPTRTGQFVHGDDHHFVLEHVFVNHPSLVHAWRLLTIVHGDLYQPVAMLTFQANYAMAGPDAAGLMPVSPYVFHLTNIILHAVNAVLACLLAARLAQSKGVGFLTGLMFACHPFALEPVAWINGRMILLATMFSLMMLLICTAGTAESRGLRGLFGVLRRPRGADATWEAASPRDASDRHVDGGYWGWWAGVCWLLALGSKVLPTVPIVAAISDRWTRGRLLRRDWVTYTVLLAIGAVATTCAARSAGMAELVQATRIESATSPAVRVLLAGRYYLENYFWPNRLASWSPPPREIAFLSGEVLLGLVGCAAYAAALWLAWRRNRTAFLGLCLFVILMVPFLAATTARRMLTADRYMYLPVFGLHLAVAAWITQAMAARGTQPGFRLARLSMGVGCVVLLSAWMVKAWQLAPAWSDTVAQARRVLEVYPGAPDAWAELARAHIFAKEPDKALEVVGEARRRWPDQPRLALQAGLAFHAKGLLREAEVELREAAAGMPHQANALYSHAIVLKALDRTEAAREVLTRITDEHPRFLPAALVLARLLREAGEFEKATPLYERVIEINPYERDGLFEVALLRMQQQRWEVAERRLAAILEIDASDQPAMLNLGVVLSRLGRQEEALRLYDRLIAEDGSIVAARLNRAELLAYLDRPAEAEAEYRAVLKALEETGQTAEGGPWEALANELRDKLKGPRPLETKEGETELAPSTSQGGEEARWRP